MIRPLMILALTATMCARASLVSGERPVEPEHLFLLADEGLIVVRMELLVDRWDCHAVWRRSVENAFAALDMNGDGALSADESTSPAARERCWLMGGAAYRRSDAGFSKADTAPADQRVTLVELNEYLVKIGAGPVSLHVAGSAGGFGGAVSATPADGTAELWRRLDDDEDGALSAEELALGWRTLARLDQDEDEALSAAELLSLARPVAPEQAGRPDTPPLTIRAAAGAEEDAALQLLAHYDGISDPSGVRDGALTADELGLSPDAVRAYDDGDEMLDASELRRFVLEPPPSIELIVRLGNLEPQKQTLEVVRADPQIRVESTQEPLAITRGAQSFFIAANVIEPADPRPRYEREFRSADADNNGYLEQRETARYPLLRPMFRMLDPDGDGRVYRDELLALGDKQMESARARVTLVAVERGRDLFQALDANKDGRLTDREFKAGSQFIPNLDANGNVRLSRRELPSRIMLTVELGPPDTVRQDVPNPPRQAASPDPRPVSPRWHERMDRNGDGEVSRREFLGTAEAFARLDVDRSGTINPMEAAK